MAQEKRISGMMKAGLLLGVCATLLLGAMSQTSYALLLNSTPDFKVAPVTVDYSSGNFLAYGFAEKYNGLPVTDTIGFRLDATIDSFGNLATGGSMYIYDYTLSNYLLIGSLTKLDFTVGNPVLNFLFTPTSGDYQGDYGSLGGIILGASGFDSSINGFGSDFSSLSASADVGTPVPEPSSVCLLLLGAGGFCFLRKRKS
ncbi:PEP-CTERM sorting domain-containing protein [Pelotalea chapellei]|uniref:PEP-CTERM sorting domain-containing protein n=1 Tax=Pelotalea chapellei TaxID=44671 RepID=A0ABS5U6U6_9BACT|nr:PEP-CTERM sorting domain-containing protein [Pelotalea chapellei]MBT1071388.1 PEP-CTERM sorting domain-containing protein [Pelotalea chapellei]